MKRFFSLLLVCLIAFGCKKTTEAKTQDDTFEGMVENTENPTEPTKKVEHEITKSKKADKDLLDPEQNVIVVFKDKNINETEEIINEKGLKLEKLLFDQNSLKIGLIKIPADKKDYWLDQLIHSGEFQDVELYSEKALKELIKKEGKIK